MFDNINMNLRKNEGFLTSIPCIPIPEYGQSNAPLILTGGRSKNARSTYHFTRKTNSVTCFVSLPAKIRTGLSLEKTWFQRIRAYAKKVLLLRKCSHRYRPASDGICAKVSVHEFGALASHNILLVDPPSWLSTNFMTTCLWVVFTHTCSTKLNSFGICWLNFVT